MSIETTVLDFKLSNTFEEYEALSRILLLKLLSKFSILFIVFLNYIIDQYIFLGIFFIEGVLIYEEIFFELKNFLS